MAQEPNEPFRIKIDSGDSLDWMSALSELEKAEPKEQPPAAAAPAPAVPSPAPAAPVPAPPPLDRPLTKYEEICRANTLGVEKEDLSVISEFSGVIALVNDAARTVEKMQKSFPQAVDERHFRTWTDNLKTTSTTMMKEFHAMRNGRQAKKYDKRYVCEKCHSVFMVSLAGNVCDECRASVVPRGGGAY